MAKSTGRTAGLVMAMCALGLALTVAASVQGQSSGQGAPARPPPYKVNRQDEDWSMMRDTARRIDWSDELKYIRHADPEGWYLSLGGELRPYYERYVNELWSSQPQTPGGWLLQRYMPHADVHYGPRVRLFAQFISGLENGRRGGPRPPDEDKLDVLQSFLDVIWEFKTDSLILRAGRQELEYGSGRLIDIREGRNVRQTFDALRTSLRAGAWRVDAFAARPVETERGIFDDSDVPGQTLWAVYAARPHFAPGRDFYYIGFDRPDAVYDQGSAHETRHTVGARLYGEQRAWDYDSEAMYQFGRFGGAAINAWAVTTEAGYTLRRTRLRPRLGVRASLISGDLDPNDPDLQTFFPLFPRGAYFGQLISIGPLNLRRVQPTLRLALSTDVTLTAEWVFYWRQSTRDGVYGVPGNLLRTGQQSAARYIGHQPDFDLRWQINRHAAFHVVQAFFLTGRFLKETPPGKNTTYSAAWVAFKF